jgi:8-oxo-dGTP pyrophosphatase MutT (NUDIX family)
MHLTEEVLAPIRARYGAPRILEWEGEISDREYGIATYNPLRTHDVTLFILNRPIPVARGRALPGHAAATSRLALIRKHPFPPDVWRPPGGGVKEGESFVEAVVREAYEETGLRVELERYLVEARARFSSEGRLLDWRTHVLLATTTDEAIAPQDLDEIAEARWGTLAELAGPLRERLLATGRAFWRYRVALHDAALAAIGDGPPEPAA